MITRQMFSVLIFVWIVFAAVVPVRGSHEKFATGDLFISLVSGDIQWRHPDGTLNAILSSGITGHAEGIAFDNAMHLFVGHSFSQQDSSGNTIAEFDTDGTFLGTWGSGFNCNPSSIRFDSAGNAYVGQINCTGDILKFDSEGNLIDVFDVAEEIRGSAFIDLAEDECTIFYTSVGVDVKRFDVCTNTQLENFNIEPMPDASAWDLRLLPDGGVLVADTNVIVRFDASGSIIQTFDVPMHNCWVGVERGLDSGTIWGVDLCTSDVFQFDLESGDVLTSFNTGAPFMAKLITIKRGPVPTDDEEAKDLWMTGGGRIFTDEGIKVTHGFELHCDPNEKPNNLQVNWDEGNKWHMEELTSASCADDPTIEPHPPTAPFDTYTGTGTGRFNGESGATAEWIFTDAGEPGKEDTMTITIRDAQGEIVLTTTAKFLTVGNHQAHGGGKGN